MITGKVFEGMVVDDLLDDPLDDAYVVEIQADGTNYLYTEPWEIESIDESLLNAPVERYEFEWRHTKGKKKYLYVFIVVKEEPINVKNNY